MLILDFTVCCLVIIDDFHVGRTVGSPSEANAPLIIDANAVLSQSVSFQGFEPVPGRSQQISQFDRSCQLIEFATRGAFAIYPACNPLPSGELLGLLAFEGPDHRNTLYRYAI
jgi:hypothetical protein